MPRCLCCVCLLIVCCWLVTCLGVLWAFGFVCLGRLEVCVVGMVVVIWCTDGLVLFDCILDSARCCSFVSVVLFVRVTLFVYLFWVV